MQAEGAKPAKTHREQFQFGPWNLTAVRSHILKSEGPDRDKFESELKLPQLPEMVFPANVLRLQHSSGFGIEFNAFDALKLVDAEHDHLKVAVSEAWKEARKDFEHINEVVKPFDWTYTTDYKGTLLSEGEMRLQVTPTTERIDLEKLKVKEKIHFYEDILLFEDELADNGVSILNVKVRVMPSGFFILMRLHVRVDNVMVQIHETRLYHQASTNYILREYSRKTNKMSELQVPPHILTDANQVSQHLTVAEEIFEKLEFPANVDSAGGCVDGSGQTVAASSVPS